MKRWTRADTRLETDVYDAQMISACNQRHDQEHGWTESAPNLYTRLNRACFVPAPPGYDSLEPPTEQEIRDWHLHLAGGPDSLPDEPPATLSQAEPQNAGQG